MKTTRLFLLLLPFCFFPILAWGQGQTEIVYTYDAAGNRIARDSTQIIRLGASQPVDTALLTIQAFPSLPGVAATVSSESDPVAVADSILERLVFTTEEKAVAYDKWVKESDAVRTAALCSVRSSPDTTIYAFGEIPLQEGITPSGGRTYSIPVPTAAGFHFVPSVGIGYNSQAGEGWAGYGWDIQGLSAITLINKNKYYHSTAKGADVLATDPVFALDGVPLVTNSQSETSSEYPLITASGNILAKPYSNSYNRITRFVVLYPNGVRAEYGIDVNRDFVMPIFPVTQMTDLEGNKITFSYTDAQNDGNYRPDAIRYGYNASNQYGAEITFSYASVSNVTVRYYAGMPRRYDSVLTGIQSRNGTELIAEYTLDYGQNENAPLLTRVESHSDSSSLRPLRFEYGDGSIWPKFTGLQRDSSQTMPTGYLPTAFDDYVFKRGKVLFDSYDDCVLFHPRYDAYDAIHQYGSWPSYTYEFGSRYPDNLPILLALKTDPGYYYVHSNGITTGDGFQTIEAVDVDGDGTDEIVKVNFNGVSGSDTRLIITVYECNAYGFPVQDEQFEVLIHGVVTSGSYVSPSYRTYYWGDFKGNGKVQLLAVAFNHNINIQRPNYTYDQTSYATLIDIDGQSKLYDDVIFSFPLDNAGSLFACDLNNDGKTELCYATASGLDVYRFGTSYFIKGDTHAAVTSSILSSTTRPHYLTDLNGDGYPDILCAPEKNTTDSWDCYAFTGNGFASFTIPLESRSEGDEFMFIDINRDGLADMVKTHGTALGSRLNLNGASFALYQQSPDTLLNAKGIVPANAVTPAGVSCFLDIDPDSLRVGAYYCGVFSPEKRLLKKVTDSRWRLFANYYEYLPSHVRQHWDYEYSVDNTAGYMLKPLPIYVLEEERAFLSAGALTDSTLFRKNRLLYHNAVVNNQGLGFCGFSKIQTHDLCTGKDAVTDRLFDPQKRGVLIGEERRFGSYTGDSYASVVNTYDNHSTTYGKLNPRLTQSVALDTLTHISVTTTYTYDSYDYPLRVNVSRQIGNGQAQTENTTLSYSHSVSTSKYYLGAVTQRAVMKNGDGDRTYWRERMGIGYDSCFRPISRIELVGEVGNASLLPEGGTELGPERAQNSEGPQRLPPVVQPISELIAPDGIWQISHTQWIHDSHGNVLSEKSAPYNISQMLGDTYTYDSDGRYVLTKTDDLGHTTTYAGYNKFGKPASATDWRGHTTQFTYDDWGNLVRAEYPDGTVEQTVTAWGGDGLYTVTMTVTGKPDQVVHYDALGREIKSGVKRFDGQWQWVNKEYNKSGQIKRTSLPYRGAAPSYWNTRHYDIFDRPDTLAEASGKLTTLSYNGTCVTTVADGVASTKTTDANGNVVSATDAGGTITYALRDDGQPHTITAPGNVQTFITYDKHGLRHQITDPSAGVQTDTCVWYVDGTSVITHTGANGATRTKQDRYGRVTAVGYVKGMGSINTHFYTYDADGYLTKKRLSISSQTTFAYDSLGRVKEMVDTLQSGKKLKKVFSYGPGSVLDSVLYVSQTDTITTERYSYANGYLTGVTLPDGTVVWNLVSENDLGTPTAITSGTVSRTYGYTAFGLPTYRKMNGGVLQDFSYQFNPANGNLSQRTDGLHNQTETFGYDALNRLTSIGNRQITYATNGDILSMDGVGDMSYADTDAPYRITDLIPERSGLVSGRHQSVTYNKFDRPETIVEGGIRAAFTYNVDNERVTMHVSDSTGILLLRYYLGGRYEIDIVGNTTRERFYLGGDAYSAPMVYVREGGTNGNWTAYNIGRDYLGSITHIATASGTLVAEYSYDPWGRLRDPVTLAVYTVGNEPELFLGRGFTGHEHLPWFGLINMNARLYDPLLGRFLSPDPYVQAPDFTQSLNRYSYALNNPLKYTDENGSVFTWSVDSTGISVGISFSLFGIPLGFGISIGWGDGFSIGVYGEVGYRIACFGVSATCSYTYNTTYDAGMWSFTAGLSFSCGLASFNASVGCAGGVWGVNVGCGLMYDGGMEGFGGYISYGSSGLGTGLNGYYDYSRAYAFRKGCDILGLDGGTVLSPSDEVLKKAQEQWYPDAPMDMIEQFSVENIPDCYQIRLEAEGVMALTSPSRKGKTITGKSSVYFSKRAFSSAMQLYVTMGHEFVHVCNYYTAARLGYSFKTVNSKAYLEMTEYWAYSFQAEYTHSTMNSFDMKLIFSSFNPEVFSLFNFREMKWYLNRKSF